MGTIAYVSRRGGGERGTCRAKACPCATCGVVLLPHRHSLTWLCRSRLAGGAVEQALKVLHAYYHFMGLLTRRMLKDGDKPEPAFQTLAEASVNDLTNSVYGPCRVPCHGLWSRPVAS